jgi:methionyl-tRNA formyltransferase
MSNSKINFVFFGTPDVAAETLEILKQSGYMPRLIVTAPDKPAGRKMVLTPPPAKIWAEKNNIPFTQPTSNTELLEILNSRGIRSEGEGRSDEKSQEAKYDLFIVVAYGKIIPEELLNMPRLGSINVHYSLLPKYRGASPVESAILNGETKTGVSIQKMVFKLDAGDILSQEKTQILPDETAPELRARLIKLGGELLVRTLPDFIEGKITPIPQDESQSSHFGKIRKEDGLIDLNDDATKNYNKFRAYVTWPRTFFFKDGKRLIITKAKLENGEFIIKKIIPEGGKEIDYKN